MQLQMGKKKVFLVSQTKAVKEDSGHAGKNEKAIHPEMLQLSGKKCA